MSAEGRDSPLSPGWFMVAAQALIVLARSEDVCPSHAIAGNLQSHAVFMRRVLAQLVRARLVEAREGREGGYRLARPAETITLAAVYQAVKAAAPIDPAPPPTEHVCAGLVEMRSACNELAAEVEDAIIAVLERHTIAELADRTATLATGV